MILGSIKIGELTVNIENPNPTKDGFCLHFFDSMTSKSAHIEDVTGHQLGAIMALWLGGDDISCAEELYELAKPLLEFLYYALG